MFNVMDVADALVNHIKSRCPQDIAIIAYYGSYAQGTATQRSDLDFFFIPATSDGYGKSIQFVLNDISFDFWPIVWERAERMAKFEETNTSIIADCKILYVRSDDDLARFNNLRDMITEMPRQGLKLIEKSETQLRDAYIHLYKMSQSNDAENINFCRHEAQGVLIAVFYSLALLNRTYFKKGWGKNTEQVLSFPLKPVGLEQQLETITKSSSCKEIRESCEQLTQETLNLLLEQKNGYSEASSYPDRMKGFYEEVRGILDKIKTACEVNDYSSAYFWSIGVQDEIARFIYYAEKGHFPILLNPSLDYQQYYNRSGLPDLIALLEPQNLTPLFEAVENLDHLLKQHLEDHGVQIHQFQTLEQFQAFLNQR